MPSEQMQELTLMRIKSNGCVGCDLVCIGSACEHKNEEIIKCDNCGEQIFGNVYRGFYGDDLCFDCHEKEEFEDEQA